MWNWTRKNVTEIKTQWKMMRHEIYCCCTFKDSKMELETRSWAVIRLWKIAITQYFFNNLCSFEKWKCKWHFWRSQQKSADRIFFLAWIQNGKALDFFLIFFFYLVQLEQRHKTFFKSKSIFLGGTLHHHQMKWGWKSASQQFHWKKKCTHSIGLK